MYSDRSLIRDSKTANEKFRNKKTPQMHVSDDDVIYITAKELAPDNKVDNNVIKKQSEHKC